jgi:hypothetical protein
MATRKVTSETGAYMSQYDQEVEKRLQALEGAVVDLKTAFESHKKDCATAPAGAPVSGDVETKLNTLISVLKANPKNNIDKLSKGTL